MELSEVLETVVDVLGALAPARDRDRLRSALDQWNGPPTTAPGAPAPAPVPAPQATPAVIAQTTPGTVAPSANDPFPQGAPQ